MESQIKTLSVRVRDKHAKVLRQWAFECNQVWNEANEQSSELSWVSIPGVGYLNFGTSEFDLNTVLKGIRKERGLTIGAATVQSVISQHAKSRKQFKKNKLKWRCSSGSKRALGWVPFKTAGVKWINGQVRFCGHYFGVFDSYGLNQFELGTGSFSEDSRGRWYFNTTVKVENVVSEGTSAIGIDLGLKTTATCSDGVVLERKQRYRDMEAKLGIAQRAKKQQRVRAIHAKIKNRRKDDNHKFSTMLVKKHGAIFVGNVSASGLAKTKMAKSVLDAGWAMLKTQLEYKAKARSVVFEVVNESYSTQACSCCGCISPSSPKGRAGLGIREWSCPDCGAVHDRDINAAKNILAAGHCRLAVGNPLL